jgi:hypothetical protein
MDQLIHDRLRELRDTATRSGQHGDITKVATVTLPHEDIDPSSPEMIDRIRTAFPAADQHEIEACVEYVTHYLRHMQRLQKPDGYCWWCEQPANRHHPLSPITVTITLCGVDEEATHEFCGTQCFAHWAAECGGGDYRTTTDRDHSMKVLMDTATRSGHHAGIIQTARIAIDRGIAPERLQIPIRTAFPAATQYEIDAAAELAAGAEERFRRLSKPGRCSHCRRSVLNSLKITISDPGCEAAHEFCEYEHLAHWAAKCGGGDFVPSPLP